MLDIICTRKEKTRVILFFKIYKMVLIILKSENCSYTGDPPCFILFYSVFDIFLFIFFCSFEEKNQHRRSSVFGRIFHVGSEYHYDVDEPCHAISKGRTEMKSILWSPYIFLHFSIVFQVCNHPELFERREAKSPYFFQPNAYDLPKLIYRRGLLREAFPSRRHLLTGRFYIWNAEYVHRSLFPVESDAETNCFASFTRFIGLSPNELFRIMNDGLLARFITRAIFFFLTC